MRQPAYSRTAQRVSTATPDPVRPHANGSNGAQRTGEQGRAAPTQAAEAVNPLGGVYVISVASRILNVHPQTLRKYERLGLVKPTRSIGMLRLYSAEDVLRVRLIRYMVGNLGMNLAGVEFALSLVNRIIGLRQRVQAMPREDAAGAFLERELDEILRELGAVFPDSLPRV